MKLTTFTSSKSQATDYYRSIGPFTRLALQKKFEHTICPQERAQWHDIYNTDIVLIQRPNSTASLGIMAAVPLEYKWLLIKSEGICINISSIIK